MNKSSGRTLEILEYFVALEGKSVGVSEISRAMQLPKSSTHALLTTMAEEGFLAYTTETEKRFRLGRRSFRLGLSIVNQMHTADATHQILEELFAATEHMVLLAKPQHDKIIFVDKVEGGGAVRLLLEIGSQGCYHLTAAGKAIAAEMTEDSLVERLGSGCYESHTERSLNTWFRFQHALKQVRQIGYADEICENDPYTCALAAAYFDRNGNVAGAIEVAMLSVDWANTDRETLAQNVIHAAREISSLNGFRG